MGGTGRIGGDGGPSRRCAAPRRIHRDGRLFERRQRGGSCEAQVAVVNLRGMFPSE